MAEAIEVFVYRGERPRAPFFQWLESLRDKRAIAIVQARINRVRLGNLGDCKPVGSGVFELRINFGPGYRIYFGKSGLSVIVLLCAGSKQAQDKDIEIAKALWKEYLYGED